MEMITENKINCTLKNEMCFVKQKADFTPEKSGSSGMDCHQTEPKGSVNTPTWSNKAITITAYHNTRNA